MNPIDTVVEYREAIGAGFDRDAPYKVGHRIIAVDGECEWNAGIFDVYIEGGALAVYTSDGDVLVAAYAPHVWNTYRKVDYTK